MSIIEVRRKLTSLPENFEREKELDVVEVTRRGKPVLAVMPWEFYETITETLEIMSDEILLEKLRQSIAELKEGKAIPWPDARRGLSL